jgi:hypothetical protein
MAEIIEIQQEVVFLYGLVCMTQHVLQLKFLMQNMKRFESKML